jgi:uncharacterized protein involved in exopolysaccharide biosynthesis
MSEFSSTHSTVDLKEQAFATVESQSRIEAELIAAESELQSLQQLYGDANIRVRTAEARIASLKRELGKLGGSSAPLESSNPYPFGTAQSADEAYLPLRQLPRLAVPYANLYRELHVQETLYDLLTQQYEAARIQEAKDIPAVNVIDAPAVPEKKSFPPRTLLIITLTAAFACACSFYLIFRHNWLLMESSDPRRQLGEAIFNATISRWRFGLNRFAR